MQTEEVPLVQHDIMYSVFKGLHMYWDSAVCRFEGLYTLMAAVASWRFHMSCHGGYMI